MTISIIIMQGARAAAFPASLLWQAQQAAALDLLEQLHSLNCQIIFSAPDVSWLPPHKNLIAEPDPPDRPFHFGSRLADLIEKYDLDTVFYCGAGSVPLFNTEILQSLLEELLAAKTPLVLTNNRHSSDWAGIHAARQALPMIRTLERDNSLAWVLSETGIFQSRLFSVIEHRPALNLDMDTPVDLAILRLHPDTLPHLKNFLAHQSALEAIPLRRIIDILKREASQVTLIGRVAPPAWQALNKVTRAWIRVFAEERGMVASERLKRGEVRSILYELYRVQGAVHFFETLAQMSEAVIMDSRVLMAAHAPFLPDARFASDLYLPVADVWLDEFTQAAKNAPIPVLLGGHSSVAGGLYAIAEMIARDV